jgi:spermidine synthase
MLKAKKVLIMGGGDLCTLREVLKHPVKKVVMVDIDGDIIQASKDHLAELNKRSWEDQRAEVLVGNALDYVKQTKEKFDLIISDLTDPGEAGDYFYSKEFYDLCRAVMTKKSILVTHGSTASNPEFSAEKTFAGFRELFKYSSFHFAHVQSFNSLYGFLIGSDSIDVSKPSWTKISRKAAEIKGELKHYSPEVHKAMLAVPKWLHDKMVKDRYLHLKTWFSGQMPPGSE